MSTTSDLVPAFARDRSFLTPVFRLELEGRDAGRQVVGDVLEVSFTDDLSAVDSFEFTVHDWDPVALRPRYSSPWDADGHPLRLAGPDSPEVPDFEPGAQVSLYFGYLEDGALPLVMAGEVVSLTPSFPATGAPTCRVRALDAFLRRMQRTQVEGNYSGTAKDVVDQLCRENDVTVRWAALDAEGAPQERVEVDGTLLGEVTTRAEEYGLSVTTADPERPGGDRVLYLARPAGRDDEPVAELAWGRTLVSFSPALSAAAQVAEVVVRGGDPDARDGERAVEVVRTWDDVGLDPSAVGPAAVADLRAAVRGTREVLRPDGVATREDAERAALARLRELAATLVTGSGSSIGLPQLRAGRTVRLAGMGARFDGVYRLTKTTHALGGSGYTTDFDARKEVLT